MGLFDRLRKKNVVQADENLQTAQSAAVQDARKDKDEKKDEVVAATKVVKKAAPKTDKTKKTKKSDEPAEAVEAKKASGEGASRSSYDWLRKPHISEKAAILTELGAYVFDVPLSAEKISVKKAVESLYKVKVTGVRMIRHIGKPVNRGRHHAKRADEKKAIVTLAKGQKLDLYEGV